MWHRCVAVALSLAFAAPASAWWNTSWSHRRKLVLDNSGQPENLMNFPVLIRLTGARIDYSKTKAVGADLRFVDANDGTLLDHEIESWDAAGVSYVWVKVPQIDLTSANDFIWMYYGNPGAAALPLASQQATWSAGYMMVQHLEEGFPGAHDDSTANGNNSSFIDVAAQGTAAGQINGADSFTGSHKVEVPDSPSLDMADSDSFLVEAWVSTNDLGGQMVVSKEMLGGGAGTPGDGGIQLWTSGGRASFWLNDGFSSANADSIAPNVADGQWHYLVGRWDDAGGIAEVFVDAMMVGDQPNPLGAIVTTGTPLTIGEEGDAWGSQFNWNGLIDEVRVSKGFKSNNWIQAQNLSMGDTFVTYGPEAAQCCGLGVTETATEIIVNGPNRFDIRFNTATGGGIDRFIDAEENTGVDLAGGISLQEALFTHEVGDGFNAFTTGENGEGVRLDLLEATPARVKVRQEASYASDGASPPTRGGLKGFGDYSIYGIGRMAIGWETRATADVSSPYTQLQWSMYYTGAAPWNGWTGYSSTFGPVASPFMGETGPPLDAFLLAQVEQPNARTDFLTIAARNWTNANNTRFSHQDPRDLEEVSWSDSDPYTFFNGTVTRWWFLTYFKPTNMPDASDLVVQGRSNDYRTPDLLVINLGKGSQWVDGVAENTFAGTDWFNEAEAAYLLDLDPTLGLDFDLDGSDPMDRYKPFFKIRQWRSLNGTPTVTVEGAAATANTDYRAAVKPFARAFFEKDVTWYSPLEGPGSVTSPQIGSNGTVVGADFPGIPPYRHGFNARFDSDFEYLTVPYASNISSAEGSLEFWYLPFYDYGTGSRPFGLFGYSFDASNFFEAYHLPDSGAPATDEGLVFWIRRAGADYTTQVGTATSQWRANQWVHLRFVWKSAPGARLEVYVDGRLASPAPTGSYATPVPAGATLYLGNRPNLIHGAQGRMDELRIYDMAEGATPLANGGLSSPDVVEHLADPAVDYTFTFAQEDPNHRGEYLWFGADSKFRGVNVSLDTAGIGAGLDLEWQYWDGFSWQDLENTPFFTDETNHLTRRNGTIHWAADPTNWALYSLRGGPDLYYVRARLKSGSYSGQSPRENVIKTDILLFQYCHDVIQQDRTFIFSPPLPTAVALQSFSAAARNSAVDLTWTTASEIQNLGFHLYRASSEEGPYERLTAQAIPGLGSSPSGASYRYTDAGLENGRTYFYKLEDIETTGKTEMHGPVSATPFAGAPSPSPVSGSTSLITYGRPEANGFRVLERTSRGAVLELRTEGFTAEPREDGSVLLSIPGFEPLEGSPSVPVLRPWVEALSRRGVRITAVRESSVESFEGLRPSGAGAIEIVANRRGTVTLRRGASRGYAGTTGLVPEESARLLQVGFQGDLKKAQLELAPLRWNGASGTLVLARRLTVRLAFDGAVADERPRRERARGVAARLVAMEKGLYEVSYESVFPKGRGVSLDALRLSRLGKPIAFHVEPEGARFAPGSKLYFLSEGPGVNPYGRELVYELEVGARGLGMERVAAIPSGEPVLSYTKTEPYEENRFYQAGLLEARDLWFWDVLLAPVRKSFAFDTKELTGGPSRLTVWLQGVSDFASDPDHHVRVYVNDVFQDELFWNGKEPRALEMELPEGSLREGRNLLQLENVGDTGALYSMVMLDRFEVERPRRTQAEEAILQGSFPLSGAAFVSGLGASHLLDTTGENPLWLSGAEVFPDGALRFRAEAGRRYLAVSRGAVRHPVVRSVPPARLKKETLSADYLVIGPSAFSPESAPLLAHRARQGLKVKFASLEDVESEFGFGETRPEAIREFLSYAYHNWRAPRLRYVLLLGDATYDFKDYLKTGVENQLPPLLVRTSYLWTASDPSFAAVNGADLLPDLAIGRLPAASVLELRAMVAKILDYEQGEKGLDGVLVLATDDSNAAGDFAGNADEIARGALAGRPLRRLALEELQGSMRGEILAAFDEGASLVSYIGHGGIHLWADENVFDTSDVASLALQPKQPLVLTMNCLNGYFHFPYFDSLAEKLLKAEGRGAIAAFSPSGLSLNEPAHLFHQALLDQLFEGAHPRLGDAVLAAQEDYAESGAFPELLSIYHLLGDPALRLR